MTATTNARHWRDTLRMVRAIAHTETRDPSGRTVIRANVPSIDDARRMIGGDLAEVEAWADGELRRVWLGDRMIVSYCEGDMVVEHFERKITFAIVLSHVCEFYWRAPYIECAEPGCFAEFVFSATRPDPVRCRAHDGIDERG